MEELILVSNHVLDCDQIDLPDDAIIRVNLAWLSSMDDVTERLSDITHDIFLDNPVGRSKPPANRYSLEEMQYIVSRFPNVRYVAVSNVESPDDLFDFNRAFDREQVKIVPKIETIKGIENIEIILACLGGPDNVIMLDHDDLFADLLRNGVDPLLMYTDYVSRLLDICSYNGCRVLRTQGVVFSTVY
jgi:hypothetical protein